MTNTVRKLNGEFNLCLNVYIKHQKDQKLRHFRDYL